jgi:cellulose synthase/poly-beta-1,6-N-acetylglucosamine synthase-like glycosyltransferase
VPQLSWRSETLDIVSSTGSAGVWRAEAIELAGGWQAASLVEGCELSFRVLFAGYRTAFVRVPVPAELPTACRA